MTDLLLAAAHKPGSAAYSDPPHSSDSTLFLLHSANKWLKSVLPSPCLQGTLINDYSKSA